MKTLKRILLFIGLKVLEIGVVVGIFLLLMRFEMFGILIAGVVLGSILIWLIWIMLVNNWETVKRRIP